MKKDFELKRWTYGHFAYTLMISCFMFPIIIFIAEVTYEANFWNKESPNPI